ncbi:uncharacterized protein LOC134354204 [Mobula hypostoma]|uniref:uncharacterized protein LOC134354204 n=1 Tax=Mobula hypostoma TaxID=723540 RepID=UPI002FC2A59D
MHVYITQPQDSSSSRQPQNKKTERTHKKLRRAPLTPRVGRGSESSTRHFGSGSQTPTATAAEVRRDNHRRPRDYCTYCQDEGGGQSHSEPVSRSSATGTQSPAVSGPTCHLLRLTWNCYLNKDGGRADARTQRVVTGHVAVRSSRTSSEPTGVSITAIRKLHNLNGVTFKTQMHIDSLFRIISVIQCSSDRGFDRGAGRSFYQSEKLRNLPKQVQSTDMF